MNSSIKNPVEAFLQTGFVLAMFFAGFLGYTMHATDWFASIPGNLGDARFNSVILEHLYQWVQGKAPSLWSPSFYYPWTDVLAFSDNQFGSGWIYIIFRAVGMDRENAYVGWFAAGTVLNYWVTCYVLRRLGFSLIGAASGAFAFAFGLPALFQEGHAQLGYRFATPLAFGAFYRFLITGRPRFIAQTAVWTAVQFFCSIYLGIFLLYLLASAVLARILMARRGLTSTNPSERPMYSLRAWFFNVSMALLAAAAVAALLLQYQRVGLLYGFVREPSEIISLLPRLQSYLIADQSGLTSWVGKWVSDVPMRHEQQMFMGLGLTLIATVGLLSVWLTQIDRTRGYGDNPQDVSRVMTVALLLLIVMTLSLQGYSFYQYFLRLPGVSSIRAVSRIVLIMMLPFGLLVAAGVDRILFIGMPKRYRLLLVLMLGVMLSAETVFFQPNKVPIAVWRDRQSRLRDLLKAPLAPSDILYVTQSPGSAFYDADIDAMILAQDLGIATLNGYSGNLPPGYEFEVPHPCNSYINRIDKYLKFKAMPASERDQIGARVRVLTPEPCIGTAPIVARELRVDEALAKGIVLGVTGSVVGGQLNATVTIDNKTGHPLSSLGTATPLRLSWRFVPLGSDSHGLTTPDWVTRRDLYFSLKPEQIFSEVTQFALPAVPGNYRFEVTLVQELVAWLHDLGMKPANLTISVN